jgi:predicted O-methyltransferase YrrM
MKSHQFRARRSLPGPEYLEVLAWIHQELQPRTYLEIGVGFGESLRQASPSTVCIGIDPDSQLYLPLGPQTQIVASTSDEFFASNDLLELLKAPCVDLAFIDGLHLFEQALCDFVNVEKMCSAASVIVLHDCIPLDRVTSARVRTTPFYSGDVWKLAMCLAEQRPDLNLTTIPTAPTGLCIVTGVNHRSKILESRYDALVETYLPLTFDDYRSRPRQMPAILPNDRSTIVTCVAPVKGLRF